MASPSGHSGGAGGPIDGINITPLVDIMLVLLLTALTAGTQLSPQILDVSLPSAGTGHAQTSAQSFMVHVTQQGELSVAGEPALLADVTRRAAAALRLDPNLQATVAADGRAPHAAVIAVLDALQAAGVAQVAFAVGGATGVERE